MDISDLIEAKMNYDEKRLKVAKLAYKAIRHAINEVEKITLAEIYCHWDGYISVDDFLYHENELKDCE
jgi:hypothetical protein